MADSSLGHEHSVQPVNATRRITLSLKRVLANGNPAY